MRNKDMNDTKHRVERALRRAKEQKGLDYIDWRVSDDDLDFILRHYDVELLRYEVRRVSRRGIPYRSSKSKLVKDLNHRKNPVSYMELTAEQVTECRSAGYEVTPKVYRIRYRKNDGAKSRGRRSGRRNIGKNIPCRH